MRHGQPEYEQVLLWLWKLTIVRHMFLLQPCQSALRGVLRLVRTQAQDQIVVGRNLDLVQFTLFYLLENISINRQLEACFLEVLKDSFTLTGDEFFCVVPDRHSLSRVSNILSQ